MSEQESLEQSITLLFLNTHRLSIPLSSSPQQSPITIQSLKQYLISNWSCDFTAPDSMDPPRYTDQIRMIHLGKPLKDDELLDQLNLKMSDVIHVSFKPRVDSNVNSNIRGIGLKKNEGVFSSRSGGGGGGDGSKRNGESSDGNNNGGGCCVIV